MVAANPVGDHYLSRFERLERTAEAHGERAWIVPLREAAIAGFAERGFPTTKDEEWRFTNVAPIAETPFEFVEGNAAILPGECIDRFALDDAAGLLVFVNGRYAPGHSKPPGGLNGRRVGSLSAAMAVESGLVRPHLARYAGHQDNAFVALNTAFMEDGAFVYVPDGQVVEGPIQFLFVSTAPGRPLVTHPRNLVVVGCNSQVTVVETYVGVDGETYFTNAATEIVAADNAVVDHYKIVHEAENAYHVATLQIQQGPRSNVSSLVASLGGVLVRNDINAVLGGEGCECVLNGLYMGTGTRHTDNHLRVDHIKPHCTSRESFRGVLDDQSRGVFSGRIVVHQDAQKTNAEQTNTSLLLSDEAEVASKPQLEILADDVKCTHGATIGQISEEAVFYLRSRGLSQEAARNLLVHAFAREGLSQVRVESLRAQLDRAILARLPRGRSLGECA